MKSVYSDGHGPKTLTRSARKRIIARLRRALKISQELVHAVEDQPVSGASDEDLLEANAYVYLLEGGYHFERRRWNDCLKSLSIARVIYAALFKVSKGVWFQELISNTVDPSIRYAAYKTQRSRSHAIPGIAHEYFQTVDESLSSRIETLERRGGPQDEDGPETSQDGMLEEHPAPTTLRWRGRAVELQDAGIALALASVSTASARLAKVLQSTEAGTMSSVEKASKYDDVLIASQDATDATRRAIGELARDGVGQSDARMQSLQVTRTAVEYALVGWRVERNRTLAGEGDGVLIVRGTPKGKRMKLARKMVADKRAGTTKMLAMLQERVVLYDGILQVYRFRPAHTHMLDLYWDADTTINLFEEP